MKKVKDLHFIKRGVVIMIRRYQLEVKSGIISLPERISRGVVSKLEEEGCLFVAFQKEGKMLFLSKELMDFADIKNKVTIIDYGRDYYEIWDPDKLERHEKETEKRYEEIAENLDTDLY